MPADLHEQIADARREHEADMEERERAGITAGHVLGWVARLQRAIAGTPLEIAAGVGEVASEMQRAVNRAMADYGRYLHLASELCCVVPVAKVQEARRRVAAGECSAADAVSLLVVEALDGEAAERATVREVERIMARRLRGGDLLATRPS